MVIFQLSAFSWDTCNDGKSAVIDMPFLPIAQQTCETPKAECLVTLTMILFLNLLYLQNYIPYFVMWRRFSL